MLTGTRMFEPSLKALRLCHRFGKGDKVHITSLPIEVEQMIETCMIRASIVAYHSSVWGCDFEFACSQSECTPMQHCSESTPLLDSVADDIAFCTICAEEGVWGDTYSLCEKRCNDQSAVKCSVCNTGVLSEECRAGCRAVYENEANKACSESPVFWEDHTERKYDWLRRIKQGPEGAFHKYDEVCILSTILPSSLLMSCEDH